MLLSVEKLELDSAFSQVEFIKIQEEEEIIPPREDLVVTTPPPPLSPDDIYKELEENNFENFDLSELREFMTIVETQ